MSAFDITVKIPLVFMYMAYPLGSVQLAHTSFNFEIREGWSVKRVTASTIIIVWIVGELLQLTRLLGTS